MKTNNNLSHNLFNGRHTSISTYEYLVHTSISYLSPGVSPSGSYEKLKTNVSLFTSMLYAAMEPRAALCVSLKGGYERLNDESHNYTWAIRSHILCGFLKTYRVGVCPGTFWFFSWCISEGIKGSLIVRCCESSNIILSKRGRILCISSILPIF
jgi:hypothetical protein